MSLSFTDANFETEVMKSSTPVLVDFWAPWCGPCKILGPVIDEIAADFKDKGVKIGKMNVDENQIVPSNFGVMSIPTVILFREGKEVARKVGFAGRPMYENLLKTA